MNPDPLYSPSFDTLEIFTEETSGERLKFQPEILVNGEKMPRRNYPQIRGLFRKKELATARLSGLELRTGACPFCRAQMARSEDELADDPDEMPYFSAQTSLEICHACRHWEFLEFRSETYDVRTLLYDAYTISLTFSKTREFDTKAPEGSLAEIAQWFHRHPKLYNCVNPTYLEKLVARIFTDCGEYCEVLHVGRPDDGGVDVVLIESDNSNWLVQVKRREHAASVESVSTIRNLLGTLVLEGSSRGIVVSTADHFSFRAESAAKRAASSGFTVRLVNRSALDHLLARALPDAPWANVIASIDARRRQWFGGASDSNDDENPPSSFNPNQLRLF